MNDAVKKAVTIARSKAGRFSINTSARFASSTSGRNYGKKAGSSLEYLDHREYMPGDDVRHIDWSALARTDKLCIKLFREEIAPHIDVIIDGSMSMAAESKACAAWAIAEFFRGAALNSGYSTSFWLIKDKPFKYSSQNLELLDCADSEIDFSGNFGESFVAFPPRFSGNGIRILISDLFFSMEPAHLLRILGDKAAIYAVIQLADSADASPDFTGNVRLVDSETGEYIELVADTPVINNYRRSFLRHQENWRRSCVGSGASFCSLIGVHENFDLILQMLIKAGLLTVKG